MLVPLLYFNQIVKNCVLGLLFTSVKLLKICVLELSFTPVKLLKLNITFIIYKTPDSYEPRILYIIYTIYIVHIINKHIYNMNL